MRADFETKAGHIQVADAGLSVLRSQLTAAISGTQCRTTSSQPNTNGRGERSQPPCHVTTKAGQNSLCAAGTTA